MKVAIRVFSVLGIFVALIQLLVLTSSTSPALPDRRTTDPVAGTLNSFPLDSARFVDFEVDEEAFARMTARQQRDQMLDWLLITLVSNTGLSVEEINQALYDLPAIRHGYMRPIANFEYGATRSRFVGSGRVAALIPAGASAEERTDYLAHVADAHRKDLGEIPTTLLVFEYALNQDDHTALLTRREDVEAPILFSEEYGYYQFKISSLADLKRFMASVDDVTYASGQGGSLTLGGRKIKSRAYRGIRVEDVAAIWQAEQKIQAQVRAIKAFETKWDNQYYSTEAERRRLEREQERDWNQLLNQYTRHGQVSEFVDGSGFSLDPSYDYEGIAAYLSANEFIAAYLDADEIIDQDSFFAFLKTLSQAFGEESTKELLQELTDIFGFQAARYDGDLQGTEVGMVLFYTDLLAKLWLLDYLGSAPDRYIDGFVMMTKTPFSPIYKEEIITLTNTRLWFGHRNEGFQVAESGKHLLLARNGARIYAASSTALSPGQEEEAAADSEAFLGWWNDHYEEVARYEPEYERLNEIMKWSLIISWLNEGNKGAQLDFLKTVSVDTSNWFPDWVRQNAQLRFTKWDSVGFFERGYKGTNTEAMPLLYSEPYSLFEYDATVIHGGVSLAPKLLFKGRRSISSSTSPLVRRSKIDYRSARSGGDGFKTFEGVEYHLQPDTPNRAVARMQPKPEAKLRGRHSELANAEFERTVSLDNQGLLLETRTDANEIGRLGISKTNNGFKVGWVSRDIDAGQSLARRLSISPESDQLLLRDPNVEAALKLAGEHEYLIKLRGSNNWMKVAPEEAPSASIAPGWQARAAGFGSPSTSKNLNLAWVQEPAVTTALGREGTVVLKSSEGTRGVLNMLPDNRGPPVARHLEKGEYDQLARNIFETPSETHEALRRHFVEEVARSNDFLANGQPDRAVQHLNDLINRFGAQPELTVRRAVAQLSRRRPSEALIDFNETLARRPDFLDEINQRLAQHTPRNKGLRLSPDKTGPRAGFQVQVDNLSNAQRVTPDGIKSVAEANASIYVMDSPSLNNLDWNPSAVEGSLRQALSGGEVLRLPEGGIAHYNPTAVYAPKKGTLKPGEFFDPALTNKLNVVRSVRNVASRFPDPGCRDDGGDADCRDDGAVYLVISNQ